MPRFNVLLTAETAQRAGLVLAIALWLSLLAMAAWARPANLDLSLTRVSDHGLFRVSLRSSAVPIPLGRIHPWFAHVAGADGRPVSGAALTVGGGMPEHGHGLPTKPRATPAAAPGDYAIEGVKFSMTGWWVVRLGVRAADGRADTVTFNVLM